MADKGVVPRFRRQITPGSVQHVICRFINHEFLLDKPGARAHMLLAFERVIRRSDWRTVGYALMSNHVHWLFVAGEQPLEALSKPLHVSFARWFRLTHGGLGPVFAERPRNITVNNGSAAPVLAYVHNNPVRASVVEDPCQSTWTSHNAYTGRVTPPSWLDVELGFDIAEIPPSRSRPGHFDDYVRMRAHETKQASFAGLDQEKRRRSARLDHALPVELTSSAVEVLHDGATRSQAAIVAPARSPDRRNLVSDPAEVAQIVAHRFGIEAAHLRTTDRARHVSRARRVAVHCWTRILGRRVSDMAAYLGIPRSTASTMLVLPVDLVEIEAVCAELGRRATSIQAPPYVGSDAS